jgi:HEPN domain-containing protein
LSNFDFLTIEKTKTPIPFLLSWHIARQNYVAARVSLQQGLTDSGCLLAEQSVEMFVKAILHLQSNSEEAHYLVKLLKRGNGKIPYFDKLLTEPKLLYFIENLNLAYNIMRFGEGKSSVKNPELIQVLDEVAFNLDKTYRESARGHVVQRVSVTIKDGVQNTSYEAKATPLYVPDAMKEAFLRDNKYFSEQDISNNFMAKVPLP